jgi:hypothetical protein
MTSAPHGVTMIRPVIMKIVTIRSVMEKDANRARMTNASELVKIMYAAVDVS